MEYNMYFLIGSLMAILTPGAILAFIYILKYYRKQKNVLHQIQQIDRVHAALDECGVWTTDSVFDQPPTYSDVIDNSLPSYNDLFRTNSLTTVADLHDIIQNKV